MRKYIEDRGALLVCTAPYSPEHNPIEFMFGEHKKSLKRLSHRHQCDWTAVHQQSLFSVSPDMAKQFFRKCNVPMMEEWQKTRNNQLENDTDALPFPHNDVHDTIMEFIY